MIQEPDCGYPLDYQVMLKESTETYSDLPDFMTLNGKEISIDSADAENVKSYIISVRGSVSSSYPN